MNFDNVTNYLDSLREQYGVRCTDCKIMKGHETIYRHISGTANYEDTVPVSENNLHDIYSASKVLTMIAVMQLIEQNKIGLEDELETYLPEYKDVKVVSDFDLTDFVASSYTSRSCL